MFSSFVFFIFSQGFTAYCIVRGWLGWRFLLALVLADREYFDMAYCESEEEEEEPFNF